MIKYEYVHKMNYLTFEYVSVIFISVCNLLAFIDCTLQLLIYSVFLFLSVYWFAFIFSINRSSFRVELIQSLLCISHTLG